jgi:hypothetical protein
VGIVIYAGNKQVIKNRKIIEKLWEGWRKTFVNFSDQFPEVIWASDYHFVEKIVDLETVKK